MPDEYRRYSTQILGELQLPSSDGKPWDRLSIMRHMFDSPSAVPLTPSQVWPAVISDLRNRRWPDPPTPQLITQEGMANWMLDRSALLRGLPYSFD